MKTKTRIEPASYVPVRPADFIGPARELADILAAKATTLAGRRDCSAKYVFTGQPGVGKTRLAEFFAAQLTGEKIVNGQSFHVESVNGRNVDLTLIRRWQHEARYIPTGWVVRIVNELDTCKQDAEDLLLTYLDELGNKTAFLGTSNQKLSQMSERFQSRLQSWNVKPPEPEHIHSLLKGFGLRTTDIAQIVLGCGGNIRAALLDAQSTLDSV